MRVCACVRVCVCVFVRARVYAYVYLFVLAQLNYRRKHRFSETQRREVCQSVPVGLSLHHILTRCRCLLLCLWWTWRVRSARLRSEFERFWTSVAAWCMGVLWPLSNVYVHAFVRLDIPIIY